MSSTEDYDLVIVGGGLVGGTLALALRDTRYKVAIIESVPAARRLSGALGQRALAISAGSAAMLNVLGVWPGVSDRACAIQQIHVSDQGHFGKTRLSAAAEDVPALGYVIAAKHLEGHIESLLETSEVVQRCPLTVTGVASSPFDRVEVDAVDAEGHAVRLSARLLVAADGGHSAVRELLGIVATRKAYEQAAVITEVATEFNGNGTAYERFTPAGPLALLPLGGKRYSVVWTQRDHDAEAICALGNSEFANALMRVFGSWLGRLSPLGERVAIPLNLVVAEHIVAQRVALVGNAIHQLHPVAGQGFNLGLRDVALLVDYLRDAPAWGEDIGSSDFLGRFAQARAADHRRVVQFTDGLVRLFSNDWWPLQAGRNLGLAVLDIAPVAKHWFARQAMGLGASMPRLKQPPSA